MSEQETILVVDDDREIVGAIAAADMAVAGITSRIPADQVIDAMRAVGVAMPCALKETGEGGLAATPAGVEARQALEK